MGRGKITNVYIMPFMTARHDIRITIYSPSLLIEMCGNFYFQFDCRWCCTTMKNTFLIVFVLLCISLKCNASIWIKNVKSYGPTAAQVGAQCLSLMSKYYFKEKELTRSRTMVVSYTRNLSIPADNIQRLYLNWVHEAIISSELDE